MTTRRLRIPPRWRSLLPFAGIAMVVGGDKDVRMIAIWVIAAITSILAFYYLPENSHVVVGALAGGIAGIFWADKAPELDSAPANASTAADEGDV